VRMFGRQMGFFPLPTAEARVLHKLLRSRHSRARSPASETGSHSRIARRHDTTRYGIEIDAHRSRRRKLWAWSLQANTLMCGVRLNRCLDLSQPTHDGRYGQARIRGGICIPRANVCWLSRWMLSSSFPAPKSSPAAPLAESFGISAFINSRTRVRSLQQVAICYASKRHDS